MVQQKNFDAFIWQGFSEKFCKKKDEDSMFFGIGVTINDCKWLNYFCFYKLVDLAETSTQNGGSGNYSEFFSAVFWGKSLSRLIFIPFFGYFSYISRFLAGKVQL